MNPCARFLELLELSGGPWNKHPNHLDTVHKETLTWRSSDATVISLHVCTVAGGTQRVLRPTRTRSDSDNLTAQCLPDVASAVPNHMSGCQNYGPFLDPHYIAAPNI